MTWTLYVIDRGPVKHDQVASPYAESLAATTRCGLVTAPPLVQFLSSISLQDVR